ncbi:MAG: J domain-containing protein [Firmicutes bacterium]|nr:J domain-containing protein [Bacillota bacterium]
MLLHLPAAGLFLKLFTVAFFASTFRILQYLLQYLCESWAVKRQEQQKREYRREREAWADDYTVLGVTPGATLQEIKAAYRRLAKVYHPDAGGDPEAFMRIHAAYQNLVAGR